MKTKILLAFCLLTLVSSANAETSNNQEYKVFSYQWVNQVGLNLFKTSTNVFIKVSDCTDTKMGAKFNLKTPATVFGTKNSVLVINQDISCEVSAFYSIKN